MPKYTWIIASVLSVCVLLAVLGLAYWRSTDELKRAKTELADALRNLTQAQAAAEQAKGKLAESESHIEELKREKDAATSSRKSLEDQMRAALESKDITISQLQGKLTVNILDRVLFDSGEAELKPEGATILRRVADILAQHPKLRIHVIGHTDNVPIRKKYASNWELSAARAIAAVRFLSESAGVDAGRLGAVGYGEFRPIADNSTPEGRARNRRIAITVLSDELVGADTGPEIGLKSPAPVSETTNAPPVESAE